MDPRRVLIVESQNEFALSLAAVLRDQGYTTALATSGAEAQREIEKRRPDLLVLRAELPDMSGFSLCGYLKKQRDPLQVVLISSDAADAFAQHQAGPTPADGYLAIPFSMEELSAVVDKLLLPTAPAIETGADGQPVPDADLEASMDRSLGLAPPEAAAAPGGEAGGPPPVPAKGPPKLPRRERRSALTDDDKQFLERVFGSIADRKAELLAEAKSAGRRPPPRRELLASPEGKLQLLREEVKSREAQIARLSEIWGARERELLSVEDRLHEKDVEVQGLKMQIDDLLRRFNEAQEAFLQKEKEHGATVDDLLLQRFSAEKDLIEVVAAKEKDLNALKRELNHRDDEITRKQSELDNAHQQYEQLERQTQLETLQGEMREKELRFTIAKREVEIDGLHADLAWAVDEAKWVRAERDQRVLALTQDLRAYERELAQIQSAFDQAVHQLTRRAETAELALPLLWEALAEQKRIHEEDQGAWQALLAEAEDALVESEQLSADFKQQRDGWYQALSGRLEERQSEIDRLTRELADKIRTADAREAELANDLAQKLERIGELEGEGEALRQHLEERERELNSQITQLITDLEATQADLEQTRNDLAHTQQAKRESEERLSGEVAAHQAKIAELEQLAIHTREEHAQQLAAEQHRAAEELQAFKEAAQARYSEREAELSAQIDAQTAEATRLREQVGNLEGELEALRAQRTELEQGLAQSQARVSELEQALSSERQERAEELAAERQERAQELAATRQAHAQELGAERQARAQQEALLSQEISALREQVGNLEGELEALRTTRADLEHQLGQARAQGEQLAGQLSDLTEEKAQLEQVLADTQNRLADTAALLEAEQSAHATLKNEFGEREAQLASLQGEFSATEAALNSAEEKLEAQQESFQREKELLGNDLAGKSQALADAQRKLTALSQEKTRRETELKLELERRGEAVKNLEAQIAQAKQQGDARLAESERKRAEVEAALVAHREQVKKLQTQGLELQKRLEHGNQQLEALRRDAQGATAQRDQKIAELSAEVTKEKGARRKIEEEVAAFRAQADTRVREAQTRLESFKQEVAQREQQLQAQLQSRTKKAQEIEAMLENATSARTKLEREATARAAAAETKERELTSKLQQALRQLKEAEARVAAASDDANAKAKVEIDRRDQQRAAEIQRLQQSLQEKSKALKVAEMELQRLKSKGDAPPAAARPSASTGSSARPPTGGMAAARPATTRPPQPSAPPRPPSDFEATSMIDRNNLRNMLADEQARPARPGSPSPMEEAVERTVVNKAPPTATVSVEPPEDDWTSVVDGLDK